MTDVNSELYIEANSELNDTLDNILEAHDNLNQRAIDLVKIDILSLGVIATGVSISKIQLSFTLVAGLIAFGYSIWSATKVYHPRKFYRGIGENGAKRMDDLILDGASETEFRREVLFAYKGAIRDASKNYRTERENFLNGLWASIAAIMFFMIAVGFQIIQPPYSSVEIPFLIIVPMFVLWGKELPEENIIEK